MTTHTVGVILLATIAVQSLGYSTGGTSCNKSLDCGWNSVCDSERGCVCRSGYSMSDNGIDCVEERCSDSRCIQCTESLKCIRCTGFIEANTGRCLDECDSTYMLVIEGEYLGRVCPVSPTDSEHTLYIVIIAAVAGAVITVAILVAVCYCKYQHNREGKLDMKHMNGAVPKQKSNKHPRKKPKVAGIQNPAYDSSSKGDEDKDGNDNELLYHQIRTLRDNASTLSAMIHEVQYKSTLINNDDYTAMQIHRNVLEQLQRVQGMVESDCLHKVSMPDDALELLMWAVKILTKYQSVHADGTDAGSHQDGSGYTIGKRNGDVITGSKHRQQQSHTKDSSQTYSTFKPDHIIIPEIRITEDTPPLQHNNNILYQRCDQETEEMLGYYNRDELPVLKLDDAYTEPIEV